METIIRGILEPYDENDYDDGWYDWWQIGGRWKGIHASEYNPNDDPDNRETCGLCGGTGKRLDMDVPNGCNGCQGSGVTVKWPTQWTPHEDDISPAHLVNEDLECYTLVVAGNGKRPHRRLELNDEQQPKVKFKKQVFHKMIWNGNDFVETGFDGRVINKLRELGVDLEGGYLVTVDYHT
jgi:hypothetical protein